MGASEIEFSSESDSDCDQEEQQFRRSCSLFRLQYSHVPRLKLFRVVRECVGLLDHVDPVRRDVILAANLQAFFATSSIGRGKRPLDDTEQEPRQHKRQRVAMEVIVIDSEDEDAATQHSASPQPPSPPARHHLHRPWSSPGQQSPPSPPSPSNTDSPVCLDNATPPLPSPSPPPPNPATPRRRKGKEPILPLVMEASSRPRLSRVVDRGEGSGVSARQQAQEVRALDACTVHAQQKRAPLRRPQTLSTKRPRTTVTISGSSQPASKTTPQAMAHSSSMTQSLHTQQQARADMHVHTQAQAHEQAGTHPQPQPTLETQTQTQEHVQAQAHAPDRAQSQEQAHPSQAQSHEQPSTPGPGQGDAIRRWNLYAKTKTPQRRLDRCWPNGPRQRPAQ